jgi:nucleoid-associated protein YgaU
LWGIANDMMGEGTMYVQVFEANKDKIVDPDLIYPGQVFTLPQE